MHIKLIRDIRKADHFQVGWKGAMQGELSARFPVPQGFCIKAGGYRHFLEASGIEAGLHQILDSLSIDDPRSVEKASDKIRRLFMRAAFPDDLKKEIGHALSSHHEAAVRCSPTVEGMGDPGPLRYASFMDVVGEKETLEAVKGCYASLYHPEAIVFRESRHFIHREAFMAVIIQDMVRPAVAGTIFTVDPVNRRYVLVEAVEEKERPKSHVVLPNTYFLDRRSGVPEDMSEHFPFDHKHLAKLFRMALQIEHHLSAPQEVEFGIDREGRITILGCKKSRL